MQTESPRGDACQHAQNIRENNLIVNIPYYHANLWFYTSKKLNRPCDDISLHNVSVSHGDRTTSSQSCS